MTLINCDATDCRAWKSYACMNKEISLDEDGQCLDIDPGPKKGNPIFADDSPTFSRKEDG